MAVDDFIYTFTSAGRHMPVGHGSKESEYVS